MFPGHFWTFLEFWDIFWTDALRSAADLYWTD